MALFIAFLIVVLMPKQSSAEMVDFTGGIKNEYTYEEYVFITGTPMLFTGKGKDIKVTIKESNGKRTETYNLSLTGPSGATLKRNFTYVSDISNHETIGQNTTVGNVTNFTEKYQIGTTVVQLVDYQLSHSEIEDSQPASDYTSGNVIMRKTYELKSGQNIATLMVYGNGQYLGYENFWGATQTKLMDFEYEYWNGTVGTVSTRTSFTKSKTLNYEPNLASLASFDGGYSVNTEASTVTEYTFDLPATGEGSVDGAQQYMPRIERLIVPKFRDLSTHWAKGHIEKLYSLGIFTDVSNFFSPNTPMMRYDFAIAIGKAVDLRVEVETKASKKNQTPSVFKDVKRTRPDYAYLVAAYNRGIITGKTETLFEPDQPLSRQQAAAMIVRALGLEGKAPDPGYQTDYLDDSTISNYARDAVYVVTELGIMTGSDGYFHPFNKLTRAQSAKIIERFLEYLESDLKQNYHDDILFFEY